MREPFESGRLRILADGRHDSFVTVEVVMPSGTVGLARCRVASVAVDNRREGEAVIQGLKVTLESEGEIAWDRPGG